MMGPRELNQSRSSDRPNRLAWVLAVASAIGGCLTLAVKSGKTSAQSPATKNSGDSTAGGAGRPREVARAPLGTLSASKWRFDNGLTAAGWSSARIEKILGANLMRLYSDAWGG